MHFAIIAAGEGSRLHQEGVTQPKPLVRIDGKPMIERLMTMMTSCHAESISVICNSSMPDVCHYLDKTRLSVPLHVIKSQTPSSMHSLALLSEVIPEGKVVVTTVDTIFLERDFRSYVEAFEQTGEACFAVTPFVDDEKPLWVSVEDYEAEGGKNPRITAFCDVRPADGRVLVSGGIYGLDTKTAWPILHRCISEGQSRMRNYQRALLAAGVEIRACVFDRIMDIDHASDIAKAEQWLKQSRRVLLIGRDPAHSPNNVDKDAAILKSVALRLETLGYVPTICAETELTTVLPDDGSCTFGFVLQMARALSSMPRLYRLKVPVINDPHEVMVMAHSRGYTLEVLAEAGVEVPDFWVYEPEEDEMFQCDDRLRAMLPGWVKATRSGGACAEDVAWVSTPLEADSRIVELVGQNVPDIVFTRHVEGDLLKVYCVVGGKGTDPFVRTFYPQETGYSKFGQAEQHNTPLAHTPFQSEAVKSLTLLISRTLGVQVFGYDAIVRPDGTLVVIDVNDWPSFSTCREEAAEAIAGLLN